MIEFGYLFFSSDKVILLWLECVIGRHLPSECFDLDYFNRTDVPVSDIF